jgi:hypothetical protein
MNDWIDDALDDEPAEFLLDSFDDALPEDEGEARADEETDTTVEAISHAPTPAAATAGAAVTRVAPGIALPPRPIPVRDKMVTYLALPVFSEFVNLATNYGELLQMRFDEVRLPADLQELASRFPDTLHIVAVVTEGDPDTAAALPIVARLVEASMRFDMRIIEDEDEDTLRPLALFLPDLDMTAALEEWDLPQIFVFDEDWELQAQWGPRPTAADAMVEAWLAANPDYETLDGDESSAAMAAHAALNHTLLYEMRVWYNSGLTRACLDEWRDMLMGLLPADEPDPNGER